MQNRNIILVGTAHVSEKSVKEVEESIERFKPDVVAIELDERRYRSLVEGDKDDKEIQVKELLKGNNFAVFIIQLLLSYLQRKIGMGTGVRPGSEMVAAAAAAKKQGADVALIDRDIGITLSRFWGNMSWREKLRMFSSLALAALGKGEKSIDIDTITQESTVSDMIGELRKLTPVGANVLIDERDAYMAHKLLEIGGSKKVLGVVGAGHKSGISRYIEMPETLPSMESISSLPKKRRFGILKIAADLPSSLQRWFLCCYYSRVSRYRTF